MNLTVMHEAFKSWNQGGMQYKNQLISASPTLASAPALPAQNQESHLTHYRARPAAHVL